MKQPFLYMISDTAVIHTQNPEKLKVNDAFDYHPICQQNGAPPYFIVIVREYLNEKFVGFVIEVILNVHKGSRPHSLRLLVGLCKEAGKFNKARNFARTTENGCVRYYDTTNYDKDKGGICK